MKGCLSQKIRNRVGDVAPPRERSIKSCLADEDPPVARGARLGELDRKVNFRGEWGELGEWGKRGEWGEW